MFEKARKKIEFKRHSSKHPFWKIIVLLRDVVFFVFHEMRYIFNYFICLKGFKYRGKIKILTDKIKTIRSNPHYRVADIVFLKGEEDRRLEDTVKVMNAQEFNNTILQNYLLENNGSEPVDLVLFKEQVEKSIIVNDYSIPGDNDLVVHVRAGDYIDTDRFLKGDYNLFINEALRGNSNIKNIKIVTCFAYQDFTAEMQYLYSDNKNRENIKRMKKLLFGFLVDFKDYDLDVVSSEDIDRDLCYMVKAKYFVKDAYSKLSHLVELLRKT